MDVKRLALITGANQGVGFHVAKELVAQGLTVLVGSRNLARGETAAKEIGQRAIPLQLDVTVCWQSIRRARASQTKISPMPQRGRDGWFRPIVHRVSRSLEPGPHDSKFLLIDIQSEIG